MSKLTFKQLQQQERVMRKVKHQKCNVQIIVANMIYIALDIPAWKFWKRYPILRHLDIMTKVHKNCCGFDINE